MHGTWPVPALLHSVKMLPQGWHHLCLNFPRLAATQGHHSHGSNSPELSSAHSQREYKGRVAGVRPPSPLPQLVLCLSYKKTPSTVFRGMLKGAHSFRVQAVLQTDISDSPTSPILSPTYPFPSFYSAWPPRDLRNNLPGGRDWQEPCSWAEWALFCGWGRDG